jgi:hypothetical protein
LYLVATAVSGLKTALQASTDHFLCCNRRHASGLLEPAVTRMMLRTRRCQRRRRRRISRGPAMRMSRRLSEALPSKFPSCLPVVKTIHTMWMGVDWHCLLFAGSWLAPVIPIQETIEGW